MENKLYDRDVEPMPKEVNFRNLDVLVNYLEEEYNSKYEEKIDIENILNKEIHKRKPYLIRDLENLKIRKLTYNDSKEIKQWGSNEFFIKLYDEIDKRSENKNIAYDIGRYVINSKSTINNFLGHIVGVESTIKKASHIMNQWNDTKKVSLKKLNSTHYKVTLLHKPHVIVNKFALEYHKGIFESLGEFSGAKNINVEYNHLKGNDYVFNLSWKKEPLLNRIHSFFLKRNKYVSSLIEKNKELSNHKSDLEKKIDIIYDSITKRTRLEIESHMKDDMMCLVSDIISEKSEYTGNHSKRVAEYSKQIYNYLDKDTKEELLSKDKNIETNLYYAGLIHDLGKITIPESILEKPGDLTDNEYQTIKEHPTILKKRISKYASLKKVAEYAYSHHERLDGSGYPDKLKEDEISYGSKILSVADIYDALTSDRPYRDAIGHNSAIEIMKNEELDKDLIKCFQKIPESKLKEIKYLT